MASNKHVDLRNTEKFLRSKFYPEDMSKAKGKKANFKKSCKKFKIQKQPHRHVLKKRWSENM